MGTATLPVQPRRLDRLDHVFIDHDLKAAALLVVYANGDVQACLVEIDMGTLTLRRFGRKAQAFEAALDDDVFRRHFPNRDEFEVLVLTSSRRRLQARRQVGTRVVHGGRHDLWHFATFEALELTAFGSAELVDLDGRKISGVLYTD